MYGKDSAGEKYGFSESNLTVLDTDTPDDLGAFVIGNHYHNPLVFITDAIPRLNITADGDIDISGSVNVVGDITADTGFFTWLGSITSRITKGWFTNLDVAGNLNQTNGNATINNIYGEMWYMNHTGTTIAFASANVSYPLFFTNAEKLNGFSFVGGFNLSSNLTAQFAGVYKANYLASGSGQNNHNYFTTVLINGLEQNNCMSHKKMTAGGDIVTMTGSCLINLVVGDNVQLSTMDYDGTGTGKYYAGNLNLVRIGN